MVRRLDWNIFPHKLFYSVADTAIILTGTLGPTTNVHYFINKSSVII